MSKSKRKPPRRRQSTRPAARPDPDQLTEPGACIVCSSRRILAVGVWTPRGIALGLVGRRLIPYAVCRTCAKLPDLSRQAERVIVRRALAARAPIVSGSEPAALFVCSKVVTVERIPPGTRLATCHECKAAVWIGGATADEVEGLGLEAIALCEACVLGRSAEPAEVPS